MSMHARRRTTPSVTTRITSATLLTAGLAGLAVTGLDLVAAPSAVFAAPGNNGTVKISDVPVDSVPENDPHVGCTLHVQWYGFDLDATSTVSFELVSPTSGTVTVDGPRTVDVGEDPDGGAKDRDGDVTYTMHPDAIPQPEQGFHERITVTSTWSNGSDTKSKVIWFRGCAEPTPTPTPTVEPTHSSSPDPTPTSAPTTTPTTTPTSAATAAPSVDPTGTSVASPQKNTGSAQLAVTPARAARRAATPPSVVHAGLAGGAPTHGPNLLLGAGSALAAAFGLFGFAGRRAPRRR